MFFVKKIRNVIKSLKRRSHKFGNINGMVSLKMYTLSPLNKSKQEQNKTDIVTRVQYLL